MVEIVEVKTKKQQKDFVMFQLDLYKDCEYFVPPIVADELSMFNPKKNANYEDCETVYYLAYKDNKLVGRIAGILHNASNRKNNQKYVRFSRVDFINDKEVAKALFDAVENWAKLKGMEYVHGPLGFNDLEREGLLIEGFDQMSCFEENYYYDYYKDIISELGYIKDVDWLEFRFKVPKEKNERAERLSKVLTERYKLHIVPIKSKSNAEIVQTTSPLLIGAMFAICTPTFPAGWAPWNFTTWHPLSFSWLVAFTPTYTFPFVSFASASTPACSAASSPLATNSNSGANGAESNAVTNMSRGATSGFAITSYGRCLINANRPLCKRVSLIACASIFFASSFSNSTLSNLPSDFTTISNTLRRSPRFTASTVPLTGDTKFTSGRFLSHISGVPAFTASPLFTNIFGTTPWKSSGITAYISALGASCRVFSASPTNGISNPLFIFTKSAIFYNGFFTECKVTTFCHITYNN